MPNKSAIDTNDFHCAAGHSYKVLLLKMVEQQRIFLEGKKRVLQGEGSPQQYQTAHAHTSR